ncbi:P-loop containing protein [Fusarium coicis]|nr:P-loop containing protein [Fusarium coicis]
MANRLPTPPECAVPQVDQETHSALKATIQCLYHMVRNGDTWDFDEPELDSNGELMVHDLVHKLGFTLPSAEAESPTSPTALEDESMSKDSASQHEKQLENQILKEEAVLGDSGLPTPCQDEQSPLEQVAETYTDSSKESIDHSVGGDTLNTLAQQWVDTFYTDLSAPIWGADIMALHWPQSDFISEASGGTAPPLSPDVAQCDLLPQKCLVTLNGFKSGFRLCNNKYCNFFNVNMAENNIDKVPRGTEDISSKRGAPTPRYMVIHRVKCPGSTPAHSGHPPLSSYLDVPRLFVGDNEASPLKGQIPDVDSQMRAKRDPTISFIIHRTYNCLEYNNVVFEALREASASSVPHNLSSQLCLSNDADGAVAEGEYMEIVSKDLNDGIEAVKEADTLQDTVDEPLLLGWQREHNLVAPYLHFYHTRNLLRDNVSQLPERQSQDINLLLKYLDKELSPDYQEAENLFFTEGLVSRKHFHKLFGPREILVTVEEGNHVAMVSKYPPLPGSNPIRLECEMWKFDGRFAKSRRIITILWPKHAADADKVPIKSLGIFPLRFDQQLEHRLRTRGEFFWKLRKPRLVLYDAPSQVLDYRMVNGRYMVDIETYRRFHRPNTIQNVATEHVEKYLPLEVTESVYWQLYPSTTADNIWLRISRQEVATFTGKLLIGYATDIVWNEDLFHKLVIPEGEKTILRALLPENKASVDVEAGRDRGSLFLFRGERGTGKTFAAEALAELVRRPLYRLTPYEVGIELNQVETNIKEAFYLGDIWDAGGLCHGALHNRATVVFTLLLENTVDVFHQNNNHKITDNFGLEIVADVLPDGYPSFKSSRRDIQTMLQTAEKLASYNKEVLNASHAERAAQILRLPRFDFE